MIQSKAMKKIIAALALALFISAPAKALNLETIEQAYIYSTYFSSFTSATSQIIDIAGWANARSGTATIVGFSYAILADGASGAFTISQTTTVYSIHLSTDFAPAISTSPAIHLIDGRSLGSEFRALTNNPIFNFSALDVTATYYIWVDYGVKRTR